MTGELPASARLAGFAVVLLAAFGAAYGVGAAAAPERSGSTGPPTPPSRGDAGHAEGHPRTSAEAVPLPGLAVSQAGYAFRPAATTLDAGPSEPFTFAVTGPDGVAVADYEPSHERDLHLVVVRRDLSTYEHVHPALAADGSWTTDLDLSAPGVYRAFADFTPAGGEPLTLGTDLFVPGEFQPAPLPAPTGTAVVDDYEVTLTGDPRLGAPSDLVFTVTRDGTPVQDLEPYLGAFGHLVALRAGDLAYLHTHPAEAATTGDTGGPEVAFGTTFPTAGTYRAFLDFQVDGQVRTAAFTLLVPAPPGATGPASATAPTPHGATPHGH